MRLSSFITEHRESILREWEDFARSIEPLPGTMDVEALRDHASLMLDTIAKDLESPQSSLEQSEKAKGHGPRNRGKTYAESHAEARLESGFSIDQLVAEFRALRASVLKLWARKSTSSLATVADDMTRFNEAIDQALAESVACYSRISTKLLGQSETRYRTLFESMDEGFCVIEMIFDADNRPADYRFLEINPAFEKHTGLRNAQGKRMRELAPDHDAHWFEIYGRVSVTGEAIRFVNEAKALDGRWFDVYAFRLSNNGSHRVAILFNDITDRKAREDALREGEARIRAFADAAPAMLWETDPAGRCTFLSREWYMFTGQTEAEALGLGWTDATHPDDQAEAGRIFLAANASRDEFRFEYRLRGAGGGYRWALDVGRPRFAATGEYLGMVGVVIDIDERKQAEEALRASEDKRRLALDAAELGTWHMEPNTNAIQTDARFRAIFGTTDEHKDYVQLLAAIHPDDRSAVQEAVAATTRAENPVPYDVEYRVVHPDGSLRWVMAKGRLSIGDTGHKMPVSSFDGTVADITERKLGEEERERLVARLREQDRRKDEFLAMLAHELRNPLAPISAAADLLYLTNSDAARVKQTSEIISRQVSHMTALVDDLLDVSRVTGGLINLEKVNLDVKSVMSGAVEQVRPLIMARRHHLSVHMTPETALVKGDAKRLIQVVVNLLNNAAKYTPEGGNISITLETDENHVAIRVADNGIGMTPEVASHAFELFAQAERTSDRSQGGLGIGLAVVDGLVKLHGGEIRAHSAGLGLGSEFTLSLPRFKNRRTVERENSLEDLTLTAANKPLKIMVVDDNIDVAKMLAMLVEALGYQVIIEHSSKRALERAMLEALDACLLDIGLPDMDGNELARQLRSQPENPQCVLIAVTGYGQDGDRKNTLAAGFDHHLVKPVDAKKLASILAQIKSD